MLKMVLVAGLSSVVASLATLGLVDYYPRIAAPAVSVKPACSSYDEAMWQLFPRGMVSTPERAAAIAEAVAIVGPDSQHLRRTLTIQDHGDWWRVSESPSPSTHRGGGYIYLISKCDASVSGVEISQ